MVDNDLALEQNGTWRAVGEMRQAENIRLRRGNCLKADNRGSRKFEAIFQ
jgi:hypothetical protein